jgi:Fe-S oxidoreductase
VRPLVGTAEEGGVIDPDVLWSCTTCGACVEQCPVDIEHVDHILDMRRYQVLIESAFPSEAGVMLRNLENAGNPWGLNNKARNDWMEGLPFEVRVVDGEIPSEVEYLFWVGCAGALEDRSKKVTRAVAELLHTAGVEFAVLGSGETCTGDPARRLGNEFVFQMLAAENVETLNGVGATASTTSRSWRPARTASTRSPTSTRSWAATTRSCTTRSCCARCSPTATSSRSARSTRR